MGKLLRIATFVPANLLNNDLASYYLINFSFLLPHTADFGKCIIIPFLLFVTFVFLLYVFLRHFK